MNAELLRVTLRVIGEAEITCHHLATLSTPRIAPLLSAFTEILAGGRLVQTDNGLLYKERCRSQSQETGSEPRPRQSASLFICRAHSTASLLVVNERLTGGLPLRRTWTCYLDLRLRIVATTEPLL
jgi:hypothetical protein